MSLPDDVISLLRDEAYLDLCRNALRDALERLKEEKQAVSETRPPFGILATKKQRDVFESSMQTVLDTEAAIDGRLNKLEAIENWLKGTIRERLRAYLAQVSENYHRSAKIDEAIRSWDRLLEHYGEQLLALARNVKNVSVTMAGAAPGTTRSAFSDRAQAFAELRMGADSLDRTALQLESLNRSMALYAANSPYKDITVAEIPLKGVVGWVDNLALLHDRDALPAAQELEADARMIVAKKLTEYHASARAAIEALAAVDTAELENYWQVLRAHALAHYVQERDVDEVLNELNERYVVANIERRQRAIESQLDPYGHER
jgi:hypothetical protein